MKELTAENVEAIIKDLKDLKVTGDLKAEEKKIEHALFFVNGERCYLLHEVGCNIEADLEGCGGRDTEAGPWSELPKQDGLWVWEGIPGWSSGVNCEGIDEGGDPIYDGRGTARRPNPSELYLIFNGPIEELWGPSQLRMAFTGLCSTHRDGEDPFCNVCYPLARPPTEVKCTTCGLPMDDRNHDGSPPGCPGPGAAGPTEAEIQTAMLNKALVTAFLAFECGGIGEGGICGVHPPGTPGCISTRKP